MICGTCVASPCQREREKLLRVALDLRFISLRQILTGPLVSCSLFLHNLDCIIDRLASMDTLYLYPTLRDYETIPHQRQLPHLPAELLTEIARHSLQREKAQLCRTSKQWKEIATKELFRNIELLVPFFHDAKMLQTMQTCTWSLCQSMVRSSINQTFTQTLAIEGYRYAVTFTLSQVLRMPRQ